ncbi:MAG TPA: carbohydrate ABC transporter permease [Euzebyales bacterium]|nr:carbohydrate ABC transporter permease [Euzebyales bacterium]
MSQTIDAETTETTAPPPQRRAAASTEDTTARKVGKAVLLLAIFAWCLFPFVWLISTSLKQGNDALNDPNIFQGPFGISNYQTVFEQNFIYNLRNTFVVAIFTTVICIVIGSFAAYALARLPLKKKVLWMSGVLAASLFPPVALVPPLYEAWRALGLLNTYPGLYIPYIAFTLPLTIFILVTFFSTIPMELAESARVDGATPWQTFYKVVLPLAAPGVFAAAIIVFVYATNEFLIASTFAPRDLEVQTATTAIAFFTGASQFERPIGTITAACVVISIPLIIMTLIFQRRIVAGLTAGSVKG